MGKLNTFLSEQAKKQRSPNEVEEEKRVWIKAAGQLLSEIQEWIRAADPTGMLKLEPNTQSIVEEKLGRYQATALDVILGAREVRIAPIARYVVGPAVGTTGAIHVIKSNGLAEMTNGIIKYRLYYFIDGVNSRWMIVDDEKYVARDFDRDNFEDAIQRLLG